jgi:hypothetical protein
LVSIDRDVPPRAGSPEARKATAARRSLRSHQPPAPRHQVVQLPAPARTLADMANPDVDACVDRSERWADEIRALRPILLRCGLVEELKRAKPCHSHDGRNVVIVQETKDFLALMFFKGAALAGPRGCWRRRAPSPARRVACGSCRLTR